MANSIATQDVNIDSRINAPEFDIASATTTDIFSSSENVRITGTTTITSFGSTATAGVKVFGRFTDALTLTHNATSLILPGSANITTAANDRFIAISLGNGNWIVANYEKSLGKASYIETATVATTSGSSIDFTGIPSNARRIVGVFSGVSSTGTDNLLVRIGDSGGFENTGYNCSASWFTTSAVSSAVRTSDFNFASLNVITAAGLFNGFFELNLVDSATNTWSFLGKININGDSSNGVGNGDKSLSGTLDRVQLLLGSNSFDAGKIKLSYFTS